MAQITGISWADSTAGLWIGCVEVSPACDHCYARELAERYGWVEWGEDRIYCKAGWTLARKFQRAAAKNGGVYPVLGRRRRIFVNSLSDFFDNHKSVIWRDDAWQLMRECPDVIFMLLTKRPQNIAKMLPPDWGDGWDNVWIGTTVEDQVRANQRIPHLLEIPAAHLFVSMEPLVGPVDLTAICNGWYFIDALAGYKYHDTPDDLPSVSAPCRKLSWVITGGESGREARVPNIVWFVSLMQQCEDAGTSFHFKQWGEWLYSGPSAIINGRMVPSAAVEITWPSGKKQTYRGKAIYEWPTGGVMARVGTKKAGHMLGGREHHEFPEDRRLAA